MIADALITEARARITWGEPSSTVYSFLIAGGVPKDEAVSQVKALTLERNAEVRGLGVKGICVGGALIAVAATVLWHIFGAGHVWWEPRGSTNSGHVWVTPSDVGKVAGILFLIGLYGIHRLIKGIFYLVRPQSDEESLSEN